MVIVAGFLLVEPHERESYLAGCREVVRQARRTRGCLDFTISADLVEANRIDIFERWESRADVQEFRGSGPSDEQQGAIISASVCEYEVSNEKHLT
jgi:quinol monooxygenase YgiN